MMRPNLSPAGASLLRALFGRAGVERDRVLLSNFRSIDWQSLTFIGERHEIALRLPAPGAPALLARLTDGLGEVEWSVPGHVVADVAVVGTPKAHPDGSISLELEALTIAE